MAGISQNGLDKNQPIADYLNFSSSKRVYARSLITWYGARGNTTFTWIYPWRPQNFRRQSRSVGNLDLGTVARQWATARTVGVRVCRTRRARALRKRTGVLRRKPSLRRAPCTDRTRSWTSTPVWINDKRSMVRAVIMGGSLLWRKNRIYVLWWFHKI